MYNEEETAILQGVIANYFIRPSAHEVAAEYQIVYDHLSSNYVTERDLHSIQKAICFLSSIYNGQPEMRSALTDALLHTNAILAQRHGART